MERPEAPMRDAADALGTAPGDPLLRDILDQPRALTAALRAHAAAGPAPRLLGEAERVLFSGMGASLFASYPAHLRLLARGTAAIWLEAGELLHGAPTALRPGTLLVLVSQSGRSAEVVRLLDSRGGARILGVTNDATSPLAQGADVYLPLMAGPEEAGVATKTLTCSLLVLDLLTGGDPGRWPPVIASLQGMLAQRGGWLPELLAALRPVGPVWVLGRGPLLAAAAVGGLMLKEAAGVHGEGLSAPQFRHGPLELAGPGKSALVLVSPGPLGRHDLDLAGEMAEAGMGVVAVCPEGAPRGAPAAVYVLPWPSASPASVVLAIQCLAHELARRQGRVPGTFSRIGKVTTKE